MIEMITRILDRCGTADSVLPPTEMFNEGWMLRLVLDWFDRNRELSHSLSFAPEARCYSEALLPSRFFPQTRGDPRAESFTHADGVIGHFSISPGLSGDASILSGAKQFIVTEAKLGSSLSKGTANAPTYDQAARNVACIANMLANSGVDPNSLDSLAFYVIAPETKINSGAFANLVTEDSIEAKVHERIASYSGQHDKWFQEMFIPVLHRIDLGILSWESILQALPSTTEVGVIQNFYGECLKFNPIRV
jgi:hypothetical protein